MKVFYNVQYSNTTIKNGETKWLINSDACFNIMRGIVSCLLDRYDDLEFLIKVPPIGDCYDVDNNYDSFDDKYHDRILFIHLAIPISPLESRFHYDFEFSKTFEYLLGDIDVMINDENTLTKNWNVLFHFLGLNIPIISTNYFLDSPIARKVPEKISYYERQMESFINSDIAAFPCKAVYEESMQAFDLLYKNRKMIKKISIWNSGCYAGEIEKYKDEDNFKIPTIYFGNRITETANRYTNWHIFAEAIGILVKKGITNFESYMLNPTKKVTEEQNKEIMKLSRNKIIINNKKFTREDYLKFINKAHISCNLFVKEAHGGLTAIEAGIARNLVIMPNVNNYKYKFGETGYPFIFNLKNRKIDSNRLAEKIEHALDYIGCLQFSYWTRLCHDMNYKYESYELASKKIYKDLKYLYNLKEKK